MSSRVSVRRSALYCVLPLLALLTLRVVAATVPSGITETQVATGPTGCNAVYPAGTTPRMAAGGPLADDIAKCQLKPLSAADYPGVTFTQTQWLTLQLTFPDGVCDWSKPGVSQQPSKPWQSFGPSPTNLLFDITKQ